MDRERVKLKLCGLTRQEDIVYANCYQPDYVGFVFAFSRRQIQTQKAKELKRSLSPAIEAVGVFVNAPMTMVISSAKYVGLDVIQLHGEEDNRYIQEIRKHLKQKVEIWKAIRLKDETCIEQARNIDADKIVFDTYHPQSYGGTGLSIQNELLKSCCQLKDKPFWIAGGLHADNVVKIIQETRPYGIDVSSGIEIHGHKDKEKIKQIVERIRGV